MTQPLWTKAPILPGSCSDLELELDQALSHIETVGVPITDLWNPWKCPAVALPYLAWSLNVLQWESSWTERVKRQVIASALDIHRQAGTRPAVEKALAALNTHCELLEWFERPDRAMEPGTFEVTAWVTANRSQRIDPDIMRQVQDAIDSVKPASRPYTLRVEGMLKASYGAAAALRVVQVVRLKMETKN
ncbi:MAG: phage tail protein I [Aeromonas sp.]